jgi:hypothetical protein
METKGWQHYVFQQNDEFWTKAIKSYMVRLNQSVHGHIVYEFVVKETYGSYRYRLHAHVNMMNSRFHLKDRTVPLLEDVNLDLLLIEQKTWGLFWKKVSEVRYPQSVPTVHRLKEIVLNDLIKKKAETEILDKQSRIENEMKAFNGNS